MMHRNQIAADVAANVGTGTEIRSRLLLSLIPGLGPRTLSALLIRFGSPQEVLSASAADLSQVSGVGPKLIHAIQNAADFVDADHVIAWCRDHETRIVCRGTPTYPSLLEELNDAPPLLFVRGILEPQDQISVAMVGTRHATPYGLKQAHRFAYSLGKIGATVVSGLARGIDAAAHRGALDAGGRTIAVLGSGLAELYPREHQQLADDIALQGAVISEYAPHAKPRSGMFPQRNRLISGLSLATFVVEAPERSGALITTRLAMEQNREVLALPGPVTSRASRGCNRLIRDGAKLVQTIDDILEELGPMHAPVTLGDEQQMRNANELMLNDVERTVLNAISTRGCVIDRVIQSSGLPTQRVIAAISVLEIKRLVRRLSGQHVTRI